MVWRPQVVKSLILSKSSTVSRCITMETTTITHNRVDKTTRSPRRHYVQGSDSGQRALLIGTRPIELVTLIGGIEREIE